MNRKSTFLPHQRDLTWPLTKKISCMFSVSVLIWHAEVKPALEIRGLHNSHNSFSSRWLCSFCHLIWLKELLEVPQSNGFLIKSSFMETASFRSPDCTKMGMHCLQGQLLTLFIHPPDSIPHDYACYYVLIITIPPVIHKMLISSFLESQFSHSEAFLHGIHYSNYSKQHKRFENKRSIYFVKNTCEI